VSCLAVCRLSGKLHRHIVQLQFSEATAVRQLEFAQKKLTRLEAQLLRYEQNLDEKDQTIYHNRLEARNKVHHLKHTIQVDTFTLLVTLVVCCGFMIATEIYW